MYDVRAIANWFLDRAETDGKTLTAMKLQKLIYVAHGWSLAYDEPLVHEAVEAWKWGPVFRSLYREFREFGSEPITRHATAFDGASLEEKDISINDYDGSAATAAFLESVWRVYGHYSASELMEITHREGTPWHTMFVEMGNQIKPFTVIPNELIKAHYKQLLNKNAWPPDRE
jgi:uncharacterized phage-associated protein